MKQINTELEKLKKDLNMQAILFLAVIVLAVFACFASYYLGRNSVVETIEPTEFKEKTDYKIELLQFDTIRVENKQGEVHRISLDELEELIIANEI